MDRVFALPQSFGRHKFIHSTRREEFVLSRFVFRTFLLLFENEKKNKNKKTKNSINKATYRFVFLAVFGFLVLQ